MARYKNTPEWLDWVLIHAMAVGVVALLLLGGCGTGIGNPEDGVWLTSGSDIPPADLEGQEFDFEAPVQEYEAATGLDCGSFTEENTLRQIEAGRQCVRDALKLCVSVKYLMDQAVETGRLVSFVSVEVTRTAPLECRLRVHAVSDGAHGLWGDIVTTCSKIEDWETPELACGIVP